MFVNGQNGEIKLQIVDERGLKMVAQTLARTRYKLRQYLITSLSNQATPVAAKTTFGKAFTIGIKVL